MKLIDVFQPKGLVLSALVWVPCVVSAAGFDVYRTTNEHSLEVRANLVNETREYWDYPEYLHDETDSQKRRIRLLQSNEDANLGPVASWSNENNLHAVVTLPGNSVSTHASSKMETEISNTVIRHSTDLSYDWQRDTTWTDSVYASARSDFLGFFRISAPQDILIEAYVRNEYGFPSLVAEIRNASYGGVQWGINWPNYGDDYGRPPDAEYSYDGTNRTARIRKVMTLAPGEYEFHSSARSGYSLHDHWAPYDSSGMTLVSITAVPETESVAMALAGLLVMGAVWRTRRPGEGGGS